MALTDHTQAVKVTGGLTAAGFRKQRREIDAVQKRHPKITILRSAEVDILEDGSLDLDDDALAELDLVVVSIHSRFKMTRDAMTRRLIRAISHPRVHILGHPTGRLIGEREPYALDMPKLLRAARDHGVMLEVNAQPHRLDLSDINIAMAREAGVPLVISTDAHRTAELDWMRFGVDQARRGWCTARDIANTRRLSAFRKLLDK